ncbi:hypothetical protein E4U22_007217 [Claviceps purpurea]|nr:hypothetical protein E4U12_003972 [Claviceps purpurea]KAG6142498.1 hypothetical protein E4U28_002684 [Claviceps purpurea]KAG6155774.1 hypothetical protein E4U37_000903 [Claviceps purpurea]KAG6164450.1 hypothetical protein E4U11_001184 [Claviceps purpurea]KAG6180785.1 hypothetical protein E4U36_004521 [Claviceps purpurea]
MPSFFQFTQGTESHSRPSDSSPLLGRFRAVPPRPGLSRRRSSQLGLLSDHFSSVTGDGRGSVHVGYGALVATQLLNHGNDNNDNNDDDGYAMDLDGDEAWVGQRLWRRWILDLWVRPKQTAVKRMVDRWWTRYGLLVFLPAALAVAWCAVPFPQYPLPDDNGPNHDSPEGPGHDHKTPGRGEARVQVNFWFFLFVYYGFYNLTALIWITKVFNLYNFNWWPQVLGFPFTMFLIAILSIAVPIPIYYSPEARFLTNFNTSWISWTFIIMATPVAIAFLILMTNERHIGLRHSLSETQRIFTTAWWTGEPDTLPARRDRRRRHQFRFADADMDELHVRAPHHRGQRVAMRRRWLPSSFVRFLWFCVALVVGLMVYVIGEAYAELYLRTLPHSNLETVVYVYGWVATVHLLDAVTGWVLGMREGERVGSYPLSWVFKLYFTLTYQTYVRALYARLRTPKQFVILQILSSTSLVVLTPIMMTRFVHRALTVVGMNGLSYGSYQKIQTRNVFIRFLAENTSMATFLGSVAVLHYGSNKAVYPHFAFDRDDEPYDFQLTFWASSVTWACELVASLAVRLLIQLCFNVDVGLEGKLDFTVWPELLPTCVAVTLHILQNMLFSIIRLQFH